MFQLENFILLNNIADAEKTEIIASFEKPKSYKKGEVIYSFDSFNPAIGVIVEGEAAARSENILKKTFKQGDTFGAAAVFGNDKPYISEIVAKTDCVIQFIDEKMLLKLFKKYPQISVNYIIFLSDRVRFLNRKISMFTCKGASMKLYRFLVENADENNRVKIVNMTSLARQTSLGRTSLYRAVSELSESGMIERDGSTITIK